jgi:serine/threonine protein phosphatase PrpC
MSEVSISGQPVILFAEECDRGTLRKENQNSVLHVRIPLGDLMIGADGIGDEGGATASRMVVEDFYTHLAALPHDYPVGNAIREAAARSNANLLAAVKAPDSPHERLSSSVVLALLQQEAEGTNAWIGHIGDSRAYLVRAGHLQCLTTDHSAAQVLLSRNLISPEEAQHHPDSAVLTRSLGHQPEVEIDIEELPLASGDTLLLCSDGLWEFVPERDIHRVAETLDLTVEASAHNLLELALAAGGHDNVGIEMARLIPPPDPPPPPRAENYLALKIVMAMLLVAVAALCVLAYLTFWYY